MFILEFINSHNILNNMSIVRILDLFSVKLRTLLENSIKTNKIDIFCNPY